MAASLIGNAMSAQDRKQSEDAGLWASSPALFLAGCFALGILLGGWPEVAAGSQSTLIPALIVAASVCLLAGAIQVRARRLGWATLAATAGFVLAGAAATLLFNFRFPPRHVSHLESWGIDPSRPVEVAGVLLSDPLPAPSGPELEIEAAKLSQVRDGRPVTMDRASGKIRLRIGVGWRAAGSDLSEALEARAGDQIQALMRLRRPRVYYNPGSFDFRARAASIDDLYWEGSVEDTAALRVLPAARVVAPGRLLEVARGRLRNAIDGLYPPWSRRGRDGAVLKAIVLGDRSSLDSATIDHFRASGLYHLLVIAGLHVGLIAALILGLLRLLGVRGRGSYLWLLVLMVAYAFLVEQRAPTLRATLMLVAFMVAKLLDRDHASLNAIGLAALALLVARPAWLLESGFQLSFGAALLIVGLAAPLLKLTIEPYRSALGHLEDVERDTALLPKQAQFRLDLRLLLSSLRRRWSLLDGHVGAARRMIVWPVLAVLWAAEMVVFSAVLQTGLLLPMVKEFHRVALAGIAFNAAAVPLMALLLAWAIPTILLATVIPAWAVWPGKAVAGILSVIFSLAEMPHLPAWLSYRVPSPPPWVAVAFAFSAVLVAATLGRSRRGFVASSMVFALAAWLVATAPFHPDLPERELEVTALDCGRGTATFVSLPGRLTVLIGAGGYGSARAPGFAPAKRWDPGENIVSPYLWSRRLKRLNVLVVPGGNLDGFESILENFAVSEIWYPAKMAARSQPDSGVAWQPVLEEAGRRGTFGREVGPGESLRLGSTLFQILGPLPGQAADLNASDPPLTLRIVSQEGSALITQGISAQTAQQLLIAGPDLRSLVFAADGQIAASREGWSLIQKAAPQIAVLGPLPVLGGTPILGPEANGIRLLRTDLQGATTVEMRGSLLAVRTFRGGRILP